MIVNTDPESLSIDHLFSYVPMIARLNTEDGAETVKDLAKRQIDENYALILRTGSGQESPHPEVRIASITASGKMRITFSSPINFPGNLLDNIKK